MGVRPAVCEKTYLLREGPNIKPPVTEFVTPKFRLAKKILDRYWKPLYLTDISIEILLEIRENYVGRKS